MNTGLKKGSIKPRVLVVDDDEMILALIETSLSKKYDISLLSKGSKAISKALELVPDLMIVDLNMPHVDGLEILRQWSSHPLLSSIPILCLSGDKTGETREQTREMGAAGFLTKPIDRKQFCNDVESLLQASNLRITSEDRRASCFIGFNEKSKEKAMHDLIAQSLLTSEVVVLSPTEGADFCNQNELQQIANEKLVYLQFRTNVFTKLPFMEDVSPIIQDLRSLLGPDLSDHTLIIEDLDLVLNYYSSNKSQVGHALLIDKTLKKEFSKLAYFFRRPPQSDEQSQLNKLTTLLIGA